MLDIPVTTDQLIAFLLVLARVGAWVWITPPFGGRFLPATQRTIVSLAFSLPMTKAAMSASTALPTGPVEILIAFAMQIAIGVAMGLACLTLISAVASAGTAIDVFGGFSLAQAFDPLQQQQSSVFSRIYQLLAGVLLLVTGGYMILFAGFSNTFQALPLGATLDLAATAQTLTACITTFFISMLQIAGPLIAVMVLADIGLGLLTRVAPTINAFSLGFPLKIGITLLLVGIAIPQLTPTIAGISQSSIDAMRGIAGG